MVDFNLWVTEETLISVESRNSISNQFNKTIITKHTQSVYGVGLNPEILLIQVSFKHNLAQQEIILTKGIAPRLGSFTNKVCLLILLLTENTQESEVGAFLDWKIEFRREIESTILKLG